MATRRPKPASPRPRLNAEWHAAHPMPRHPSLQQRIDWHLAHAHACGCRPIPASVQAALAVKRRPTATAGRKPAGSRTESAASVDIATFSKLALALPGAEEIVHRGHPAFSVREKIFATLWPGEKRAVLKLSLEDQADLVAARPAAFSLNAWSRQGWTNLHLEHASVAECRELLQQAWRTVAPKKLVRAYDEAEPV